MRGTSSTVATLKTKITLMELSDANPVLLPGHQVNPLASLPADPLAKHLKWVASVKRYSEQNKTKKSNFLVYRSAVCDLCSTRHKNLKSGK